MTKEEIKIREIFNRYRKSLHIQKLNEEGYLHLFEDDDLEDLTALKKHQLRVEMTNKILKPISKLFITNCFIKRSDDAWWFGIYSRSTYYRLKKEAIKEFLYYFNL